MCVGALTLELKCVRACVCVSEGEEEEEEEEEMSEGGASALPKLPPPGISGATGWGRWTTFATADEPPLIPVDDAAAA